MLTARPATDDLEAPSGRTQKPTMVTVMAGNLGLTAFCVCGCGSMAESWGV
jgi:hypothetical protein